MERSNSPPCRRKRDKGGAPVTDLVWQTRETHCEWGLGCFFVLAEPAAAGNEAVTDQGPDRLPAVGMADFFPFDGGARIVRDGDLGDFLAHAAKLGGHFGTELEAATFELYALQQGAANGFVAGSFIVNAGTVQNVGQVSQ